MFIKRNFVPWAGAATLALALAACETFDQGKEKLVQPLTPKQATFMVSSTADPRTYWITPGRSEDNLFTFAGGNRLHADEDATLACPKTRPEGMPVAAIVSGVLALFDTSSHVSWIDYRLGRELNAKMLGPSPYEFTPRHVNEAVPGYASVVDSLPIGGDISIESAVVFWRCAAGPLGYLARRIEEPAPRMVIGADLLARFSAVTFDFPRRQIKILSTGGYRPDPDRLLASVPLLKAQGLFAVAANVGGQPQTLVLDTAGDYDLALSMPPQPPQPVCSIGDLIFRNTHPVLIKDEGLGSVSEGRIGHRLLAHYKVTLDNQKQLVHFERPEQK